MKERILTQKAVDDFAAYLKDEEKSENTIKKYIRDIQDFMRFMNCPEITKGMVVAYKNQLITENSDMVVTAQYQKITAPTLVVSNVTTTTGATNVEVLVEAHNNPGIAGMGVFIFRGKHRCNRSCRKIWNQTNLRC